MPIKENVGYNLFDAKNKNDQKAENPIIDQVVFFAKMFEKYASQDLNENNHQNDDKLNQNKEDYTDTDNLKEVIYKTYAKSIDQAKKMQKKEKRKLKKIMDLLIYLQMKKIELKLNYFNDFDKLIQFNKQQIKTI